MNIVDVIIVLVIIMSGLLGLKRGFTRELVSFLGIFAVVVLSFLLKNPVSIFLYEHLPFFKFGGLFKGITALNILLYEVVALCIVMSILIIILKVISMITRVFEKLLTFTIILGIPSKILGLVVGIIEGFVWVFIGLYILNLPVFNIEEVHNSKYKNGILENTPILSNFTKDQNQVIQEFKTLKEKYETTEDANEFNLSTIELFLKYDVITVNSLETLVAQGKIDVAGIQELITQYKKEG